MTPTCSSSNFKSDNHMQHPPIANPGAEFLISWMTAQINAICHSILINPHQVTEKSIKITKRFRNYVQKLEDHLVKEKSKHVEKLLSHVYKKLQCLECLIRGLPEYNVIDEELEKLFLDLTWGNPLLALSKAEQALLLYQKLNDRVDPATSLYRFLMMTKESLSGVFETWTDHLISSSQEEYARLLSWESESSPNLIKALRDQLKEFGSPLKNLIKGCKDLGLIDVADSLQNAEIELSKLRHEMIKHSISCELVYGSKEWENEIAKCPNPDQSLKDKEWSNQTKSGIGFLLTASLLLQGFGYVYLEVTDPNRRAYADSLQREMLEAVSDEMREQIFIESSQLKSSLETYYGARNALVKYGQDSHRETCSLIEPYFKQVISQYGKEIPSPDGINQIVNDFMLHRYVQESPKAHPYKCMGFGKWCDTFTRNRNNRIYHNESNAEDHTTSFATKTIMAIGSWLGLVKKVSPTHQAFVMETCLTVRNEIEHALIRSRSLQNDLVDTRFSDLRQSVNLLRQELLISAYNPPAETCPLQVLANWRQNVHDTCYALKSLEKSVAKKMGIPNN